MRGKLSNRTYLWIAMLLTMILGVSALTGCSLLNSGRRAGKTDEKLADYDERDQLPSLIAISGETKYMMMCPYGDTKQELLLDDGEGAFRSIYAAEDVSVWYLYTDGEYAAWAELGEDQYEYKIYSKTGDTVDTIAAYPYSADQWQSRQCGFYGGCFYHSVLDYDAQKTSIEKYDPKTQTAEIIFEAEMGDYGITSLEVQDNILVAGLCKKEGEQAVLKFDLEERLAETIDIPDATNFIYAVSYDKENDLYAIYYLDANTERENIGTFADGDQHIKSLYTLSDVEYAYRDKIQMDNGHLFWVTQKNVSGEIADHYKLIDYDCAADRCVEYQSTFGFCLTDDSVYVLQFDGNAFLIDVERIARE